MAFGINKKFKIVLLCHFSNSEIREKLPLSGINWINRLKSLIAKKANQSPSDFSPWIANLIHELEKFEDVELDVIAPFNELMYFNYEFSMRGIHYHFFNPEPFLLRSLKKAFFWRREQTFFLNRFFVRKIIHKVKPDLVNLIGAENPYYSITSLDIKDIPVFVSAQTVYTNPVRSKHSDNCIQSIWDLELKIHQKERYFGCTGRMYRDLILLNNPDAIIFKMFYPIGKIKPVINKPKIYDFVFFAGIAQKKGIEDLIEALAIVKKIKKDVSLNIIGTCSSNYMNILITKINELKLENNIIFDNYFQNQSDMHQHIVQSRIAVLPIKLDVIPGSVVEAILLNIPVVTYKTSGTPYLNKDAESVMIGEIGDIQMLATNMLKLMNSPELALKLCKNAKAFVEREFDNTKSGIRFVNTYKAIIEHYHNNTPIPESLLFNTNEFPLY